MRNNKIRPKDKLLVLLEAQSIPHQSVVTKRGGEQEYMLLHELRVYPAQAKETPTVIEGLFLIGPMGSVNQIHPGTRLHWHVLADVLVGSLQRSWDEGPSQ